jgi:DNA polymerase III alpha subunit (gram-positive type)
MTFVNVKNISEAKIAMTDLETSGDVFGVHEILEIGLVLFDQKTFEILDTLEVKIKPEHIENAAPAALERNGYNEKDWEGAVSLEEGMKKYAEKTKGAIFCAYNATFDWGFMNDAFRKTGVVNEMDYHRLDLLSLAWQKGLKDEKSWSLKTACGLFGVPPEPDVHGALNGAMTAYELYKKIQN